MVPTTTIATAITRRALFPDEPVWTASMTRVTKGNVQ
jgi:hypothetical protein